MGHKNGALRERRTSGAAAADLALRQLPNTRRRQPNLPLAPPKLPEKKRQAVHDFWSRENRWKSFSGERYPFAPPSLSPLLYEGTRNLRCPNDKERFAVYKYCSAAGTIRCRPYAIVTAAHKNARRRPAPPARPGPKSGGSFSWRTTCSQRRAPGTERRKTPIREERSDRPKKTNGGDHLYGTDQS